jgi:outer membrane receptor protein involved in Fe transport
MPGREESDMGKRAILLGAAGVIGLAAFSGPALAQEAEVAEEIVVTAQKREENLFDVPLAVQALGAEQLENAGVQSVAELTSLIPGASVVSASTPGFDTIQIRGIASGTTGDGLVGYYIDETPFGVPNLQLTPPAGMLDIERVEVVRGPSGTLYGQGSMGGTIKLVTARPDTSEFSGRAQLQSSSTSDGGDNLSVAGVVNIPIVTDQLAIRIAGSYDELGGYAAYDDIGTLGLDGEDVNDFTGTNIRATALLTPSADVDVSLMYWRIDNEQGAFNTLSSSVAEPTILGFGRGPGFTNIDMDLYAITLNWDLGFGVLTSNSSYVDHTLDFDLPIDVVGFGPIFTNDSTFDTTSFTQELRLTSTGEGALRWMVGGFYRDATIESDICFYIGACAGPFRLIDTAGPIDTTSWSVFGEASLSLFDGKLVPLVGVRYFEDERSANGLDRITSLTSSVDAEWDSVSPRFNLTYNATDNFIVYLNAAKGFRSGTLQTDSQAATADILLGLAPGTTQNQVDPDELWTYEIGSRWQSPSRDWLIEASVYRTDWEGVQTQFGALASIINGGDYEITGFDLGIMWRPVDGLTLQAVANVNDSEITNAPAALSASLAGVQNGARPPNVPENNYTLAATYERPLNWFGGSNLSLYSSYAYRGDQLDATTGVASDDITDLTLRAGIDVGAWRFEAFALNALDEDSAAVVAPTTASVQIPYPRRVGVQIGMNF